MGMFNLLNRSEDREVFLLNQPVTETKILTEKLSELEGEQALEKDRLVSLGKSLEARIGGIEDLIKSLMKHNREHDTQPGCKGDCKGVNCKAHEPSNNPAQRWGGGKSLENEKCFWCGLFGHFQADCEDLKSQIRLGNVKMNHEGKLRLKDGSFIPKFPADASLKERVDRHYARNPSQYYYGEYEESDPSPPAAASVLSHLLGSSSDADKRTISALRFGPVPVLDPSGLKPQTEPVLGTSKSQKNQTGTGKNRPKPVQTGSDQLRNQCSKMWFKTSKSANIL